MMCHNGEINTLRGNVNWMLAREATAVSPTLGPHKTAALFPTCSDEYVVFEREWPHFLMLSRECQVSHSCHFCVTHSYHKKTARTPTLKYYENRYSDSGNLDAVLELLTQTSSMSMPEAILMLVPEAYQSKQGLHPDLKGLYVVFAVCQLYVTHSYHHSYHKKSTLES